VKHPTGSLSGSTARIRSPFSAHVSAAFHVKHPLIAGLDLSIEE
jgi:hypothetical protein